MKKVLLTAAHFVLCATAACAAPQEPDAKHPLICDPEKPVKLFVSFMFMDRNRTNPGFGNAYMCWDRDVDTQEEMMRLSSEFNAHPKVGPKGGTTTILSVMKLRR